MPEELIDYETFKKMNLIIARVVAAEVVPNTDKLISLRVDDGKGERTIVAGIREWVSPEEITGKSIVLLENLEPRKVRGIESRGMLLAGMDDTGNFSILVPEKDVLPPGSKIT